MCHFTSKIGFRPCAADPLTRVHESSVFLFCFCMVSSGKHKPKHNIFSQIRPSKRHIVGVKKLANPDNNKYYVTAHKGGGSEAKKAIGQKSNISLRMTIWWTKILISLKAVQPCPLRLNKCTFRFQQLLFCFLYHHDLIYLSYRQYENVSIKTIMTIWIWPYKNTSSNIWHTHLLYCMCFAGIKYLIWLSCKKNNYDWFRFWNKLSSSENDRQADRQEGRQTDTMLHT